MNIYIHTHTHTHIYTCTYIHTGMHQHAGAIITSTLPVRKRYEQFG